MKKLTIFQLVNCPYCVSAKRAVNALKAENPAYEAIEIEWVDESKLKTWPSWCDYYYVPTVYMEEQKLYEAHPGDSDDFILGKMREAFDAALA